MSEPVLAPRAAPLLVARGSGAPARARCRLGVGHQLLADVGVVHARLSSRSFDGKPRHGQDILYPRENRRATHHELGPLDGHGEMGLIAEDNVHAGSVEGVGHGGELGVGLDVGVIVGVLVGTNVGLIVLSSFNCS